jgi:hypothetical protein
MTVITAPAAPVISLTDISAGYDGQVVLRALEPPSSWARRRASRPAGSRTSPRRSSSTGNSRSA